VETTCQRVETQGCGFDPTVNTHAATWNVSDWVTAAIPPTVTRVFDVVAVTCPLWGQLTTAPT
jgi:hypothetical protein